MEVTYQQILAEQYEENARTLLVQHKDEYEYDEVAAQNAQWYEENEIENPEEFNKFHGDRNKPEHVVKPKADTDSTFRNKTRVKTQIINIDTKFRGNIVPIAKQELISCSKPLEEFYLTGTSSSFSHMLLIDHIKTLNL
jgi:actin-related protein